MDERRGPVRAGGGRGLGSGVGGEADTRPRDAFGTNAILNGVDVVTGSELMGHASTEITTGVYVHLAEQKSYLQNAVIWAVSTPPAASRDRGSENHPPSRPGDAPPAQAARRTPGTRPVAPR